MIGTTGSDEIVQAVVEALAGQTASHYESIDRAMDILPGRVVTTGGHYAFLKIAEGCDKHCTYFAITDARSR